MSERLAARGADTRNAALASVAMACGLLGLKIYAVIATGSVAMLGSLADTALDILASLVTLLAVWMAAQPADGDHRFGHGKAEALAALFQTLLIAASAVGIGWRAVLRLGTPQTPEAPELGISVSLVAIAATLLLIAYQRRVVARTGSVAIATDRMHYQSDLLLNAAVIGAFVADSLLGLRGADAVFGLAIAAYLVWGAWSAASQSVDMLMDREWSADRREALTALLASHPSGKGVHALRTRTSGATDFIQFHLWLPPLMTVTAAHDIVEGLETAVEAAFPGAEVLIHVDPEGHIDRGEQDIDPETGRLPDAA